MYYVQTTLIYNEIHASVYNYMFSFIIMCLEFAIL